MSTRSGPSAIASAPPRKGREPRVYVLLLNWRGWADTIECLESLFRQRYGNYRVVVCDNHSPDDSLHRIRAWAQGALPAAAPAGHPLRHLSSPPVAKPISWAEYDREQAEGGGGAPGEEPPLVILRTGGNLGFAGGNNVGLRYILARGDADYVWVLNNDTVVGADTLATMVGLAAGDPGIGMVGSKLLYYDEPDVLQAVAGGKLIRWQGMAPHLGSGERDAGQWDRPVEVDCILGASLLVRAGVVRSVGLLDERYFMYSEELDWCWRARRDGWRLVYAPGSVVWHKAGRSAGQKSPLQDYHSARGTLLFVQKHFPHLLPIAVGYSVYRCLLPKLVRRQPERARAVLHALRDFVAGAQPARVPGRVVEPGRSAAPAPNSDLP